MLTDISFPDSFRAQYFIRSLHGLGDKLGKVLSCNFGTSTSEITRHILEQVALEMDGIILPTVAEEINKASQRGVTASIMKTDI